MKAILDRTLLVVCCLVCSTACKTGETLSASFDSQDFRAVVTFGGLTTERAHTQFVRGRLRVTGKDAPLHSANLQCFVLQIGQRRSEGIYVDSPAHVLTEQFRADDAGQVDTDVYWVFSGSDDVLAGQLTAAELLLDPRRKESGCVTKRPSLK